MKIIARQLQKEGLLRTGTRERRAAKEHSGEQAWTPAQ